MRPVIVDWLNHIFGTEIFNFIVPGSAGLFSIAMLICMILFVRRCGRADLQQVRALGASMAAMVCGLIGARLLFVVVYHDYYPNLLKSLLATSGATISWGAYIGGLLGFIGYLSLCGQSALPYLDALGSVMGLGTFIGRWGCFLNGCDFGTVSRIPWAVSYPHASIPFVEHVRRGWIDPLAEHSLSVHPVQLYLSINGLILFLAFSMLWKRPRLQPGMLFCLYWTTYSFTRFFLEFFRGDTQTFYFNVFSIGQMMTILVFFASVMGIIFLQLRIKCESIKTEGE